LPNAARVAFKSGTGGEVFVPGVTAGGATGGATGGAPGGATGEGWPVSDF
jgi:hypothetical protein